MIDSAVSSHETINGPSPSWSLGSVSGLVLFFLLSWFKSHRQLQSEEDVRMAEEKEANEPDAPKPIYRNKNST